jgi:septum formation protein
VLASGSPRRRELLNTLGVRFEVVPADIEETPRDPDPVHVAEGLALEKARAVASKLVDFDEGYAVLAADTVVALDGVVLGKPRDVEEARAILHALRGRIHLVVTGVAMLRGHHCEVDSVSTEVRMRRYSDEEIDAYVARSVFEDGPYDKAGAYAIQDATFHPVAEAHGCVSSVIGLPLWRVRSMLQSAGIQAAPPALERCASCPLAA